MLSSNVVGSVFGDDSTILVDAVNGLVVGDVLNFEVTTTDLNTTNAIITTINGPADGNLTVDAGESGIIDIGSNLSTTTVNINNAVMETFDQGSGLGVATLTATTDLVIEAGNRIKLADNVPFKLANISSTAQLAIAAQNGDVVYNTTTNKFQGYADGAWVDLH
jgi:hypothetical protein